MGLTRHEQETVISWNAADPTIQIWTAEPKTLRKLKKLGYAPTKNQGPGAWFTLEKRAITLRRPGKRAETAPQNPRFRPKTPA